MTTDVRPEQRLTILKHLATSKSIDVVTAISRLPRETVSEVAQAHGYPDAAKLQWAVDVVQKKIEEERDAIPESALPQPRVAVPRPATSPTPTTPMPAPAGKPDEFRVLINTAKNHDRKRIQRLGEKILEDLAKLRGLIDDESEAFRARQAETAERAAARAEVERLKKQLAAAQAKLNGPRRSTGGPSPAVIRSWAESAGVECPAKGRVPAGVRDAYTAAHPEVA